MTVFAILFEPENTAIASHIKTIFPNGFALVAGQYFVSESGITSVQIAEKLGGMKGERGRFVVLAVNNYWGWHNNALWEWLKANPTS